MIGSPDAAHVGLIHLRLEAPDEMPPDDAFVSCVDHIVATLVP